MVGGIVVVLSPVAVAGCAINLIVALILGYIRFRRGGRDWLEPFALAHVVSAVAYAVLIPYADGPSITAFLATPWGIPISFARALAVGAVIGGTLRLCHQTHAWRPAIVIGGGLSILVLIVALAVSPYAAFQTSIVVGAIASLAIGIITLRGPTAFYRLAGITWLVRGAMVPLLAVASSLPNGQGLFDTVGILNVIFISATGFSLLLIELDDTLQQAQEASVAKTQFIANMSHELRTPLNAVIGFAELLEGRAFQPSGAQIRNYAGLIQDAGRHLLGIINALLDMASIEARRENLFFETTRIDELVGASIGMLASEAERKQIALRSKGCEAPISLVTDSRAMRQILLNLIGNAVKFSEAGTSVDISVERGHAPDQLKIHVADQGPGISPKDLQHIFEPFWQAGDTFSRAYGGIGLGLPIAQHLARALAGSLLVESVRGKGSIFTLILPLSPLKPA